MKKMQRCDDEDDSQASNDPSSGDDRCPCASSPYRSFLEVSFLRVPVSINVGYQIRLYRVKVFNEAVSVACGMATWYG
jgi:hypothetical protein